MLVSIIGFIITAFLIDNYPTWGFALMFLFILMFISSLVSMTHAPVGDENHHKELAVHHKIHGKK